MLVNLEKNQEIHTKNRTETEEWRTFFQDSKQIYWTKADFDEI
jgi:hypothetical protein